MAAKPQPALFRALGDTTRLAIFEHLSKRECSVNEITDKFPISQPAVSQHLRELRRCGLVHHRKEGRHAFYRARPEGLAPINSWLEHYRTFWPERMNKMKDMLASQRKGETK